MHSFASYELSKQLAREKRKFYNVVDPLNLRKVRKIYKAENIKIHLCKESLRNLRAAYFNDKDGCDVILNDSLPNEAKIFSLLHELKHHYLDKDQSVACEMAYGVEPIREKSAEVFAAEFIWPYADFVKTLEQFGLNRNNCTADQIIYFKRNSRMPVSYQFLIKRLHLTNIIDKNDYAKVKFKKREEQLFGIPFYKKYR